MGVIWLAMCGSAAATPSCFQVGDVDADSLACTKHLTARRKPQSFVALGHNWTGYVSRWTAADGHEFLTGYQPPKLFGRYRSLRVLERIVDFGGPDQKMVVRYRSVGSPQRVTFSWQAY